MSDRGALADQAWAAASEVVDRYMTYPDTDEGAEIRAQMIALAAVCWLEGRDAGGHEAIAVIQGRMSDD